MNETEQMREAIRAALERVELTSTDHRHDCGEQGCIEVEVTETRPVLDLADELLAELERSGWKVTRNDPFASAPALPDEILAQLLDQFQEAAESHGYDRTEGTAGDARRSAERLHNTRLALVRAIINEPPVLRAGQRATPNGRDATELENSNEAVWEAHMEGMDCGLRPCRQCGGSRPPGIGAPAEDQPWQSMIDQFAIRMTGTEDRLDEIERRLATWVPQEQA